MKNTLKGYLLGILTMAVLTGSITYAASRTTTLNDVMVGDVKIVVDGKELIPTDANGKRVEPMIYQGTTYLPVRAVANAFDKAVYWDGPNYTVYLGTMDGKLEYPTVKLVDMTSINQQPLNTDALTDNYDNRYSHAIYNRISHTEFEYLLNMKYSKFKGTLYVPKGANKNKNGYLTIEADGKTIYTSPEMNKTSKPINIDVSVRGYNNIKIRFSSYVAGNSEDFPLNLANAGFYQ